VVTVFAARRRSGMLVVEREPVVAVRPVPVPAAAASKGALVSHPLYSSTRISG
jgi:hypothetical protein